LITSGLIIYAPSSIDYQAQAIQREKNSRYGTVVKTNRTAVVIPLLLQAVTFQLYVGLGLSITYDIVKKHSGDITVTSEPGTGTTFTI
jgi:light-regulated signal transduction histidine kinase (bacteriophytochrome)